MKPYAGSEALWEALDWPVPVNEGSDMFLTVFSREVIVGCLEIQAAELLRLPKATDTKDDNLVMVRTVGCLFNMVSLQVSLLTCHVLCCGDYGGGGVLMYLRCMTT